MRSDFTFRLAFRSDSNQADWRDAMIPPPRLVNRFHRRKGERRRIPKNIRQDVILVAAVVTIVTGIFFTVLALRPSHNLRGPEQPSLTPPAVAQEPPAGTAPSKPPPPQETPKPTPPERKAFVVNPPPVIPRSVLQRCHVAEESEARARQLMALGKHADALDACIAGLKKCPDARLRSLKNSLEESLSIAGRSR